MKTSAAFLALAAASVASAALLNGCATINTKGTGEWGHKYSGTKCAAETLSFIFKEFPLLTPFFLPDLALSAVADSLVVPIEAMSSSGAVHEPCTSEWSL